MNDTITPMQPEGSKGSLVGSVIIVLILIIGAVYLYFNRSAAPVEPAPAPSAEVSNPAPVTPADDVASLEADASSTDTVNLDSDLKALDAQFQ